MRVSIIGAGPVGCMAARYGVEEHDVTVYEASRDKRMQCSGLISRDGLLSLGINIKNSLIQNRVKGARFYSPSGEFFEVDGGETKAYVLDRVEFDNYLLDKIIGWDVDVIEKRIKPQDVQELVGYNERVVLATGTNYGLHKSLKLDMPDEFLYGAQYELRVECDSDFVELHFNNPDFFSWIIPVDEYARIGLCAKENPTPLLHRFIKKLGNGGRIKSYDIRDEHYGVIPIHKPSMRTAYGRVVLVGDAAGHVKASTGGGVVMGGRAAGHLYKSDYDWEWRRHIGSELKTHLMIYRLMSRLSDKNKDKMFSILSEHKNLLEDKGDMDSAIKSLTPLITNPGFVSKMVTNLPSFAYDILL